MKPPKDIPSYVAWVLDQKPELDNTPAEVKAELKQNLTDRLERLINTAIAAQIPKAKLDEFDALLVDGDEAKIQKFIHQQVPNVDELIAEILISFRNDYLGDS